MHVLQQLHQTAMTSALYSASLDLNVIVCDSEPCLHALAQQNNLVHELEALLSGAIC